MQNMSPKTKGNPTQVFMINAYRLPTQAADWIGKEGVEVGKYSWIFINR